MNEWTKVKMQVANCYFVPLCRSALGFTTLLSYIVSALIAGTSTVALTLAQQTPRDMLNGSISPVTMNCRIFSVLPLFVCSFWTRNSNSEFWYLHLRWSLCEVIWQHPKLWLTPASLNFQKLNEYWDPNRALEYSFPSPSKQLNNPFWCHRVH